MSRFHIEFSGQVRKPEVRDMGDKKILSFQLMKKNYAKDKNAEPTWTHVNFTLFDAKPFQIDQFKQDVFVAGGGEFSMRSWVDKDGNKRQSADVRIDNFGLDSAYVPPNEQNEAPAAKVTHRQIPANTSPDNDSPF